MFCERRIVQVQRDVRGHELEPGLAGAAAARELFGLVVRGGIGLVVLPRVVGKLMIVPDRDHGEARVQRLQARIGTVALVQRAIVGDRGGVDRAVRHFRSRWAASAAHGSSRSGLSGRGQAGFRRCSRPGARRSPGLRSAAFAERGPMVRVPVLARRMKGATLELFDAGWRRSTVPGRSSRPLPRPQSRRARLDARLVVRAQLGDARTPRRGGICLRPRHLHRRGDRRAHHR